MKMDVDEWRAQFAAKLRETGEELLELTRQELQDIPPAARAYTLAVLIDKSQVLEGKNALQNSQVNVQINNFGSMSREELMKKLSGQFDPQPAVDVQAEPAQTDPKSNLSPEIPG
jgi:rRNA pseudouridine-1189 N-methylase Emg1 (Nep1/Mra1 family)